MILLCVLLGSTMYLFGAWQQGNSMQCGWIRWLRWALAALFLFTASGHWGPLRPDIVRMVPPSIGHAEFFVTFTGIAEIAGALGLLVPRVAPWAASGLALMLICVFPANVHAANEGLTLAGHRMPGVIVRGLMQVVLLVLVLVAGFAPRWRRRR
jgi:uncharacterized membrane protein